MNLARGPPRVVCPDCIALLGETFPAAKSIRDVTVSQRTRAARSSDECVRVESTWGAAVNNPVRHTDYFFYVYSGVNKSGGRCREAATTDSASPNSTETVLA